MTNTKKKTLKKNIQLKTLCQTQVRHFGLNPQKNIRFTVTSLKVFMELHLVLYLCGKKVLTHSINLFKFCHTVVYL